MSEARKFIIEVVFIKDTLLTRFNRTGVYFSGIMAAVNSILAEADLGDEHVEYITVVPDFDN